MTWVFSLEDSYVLEEENLWNEIYSVYRILPLALQWHQDWMDTGNSFLAEVFNVVKGHQSPVSGCS